MCPFYLANTILNPSSYDAELLSCEFLSCREYLFSFSYIIIYVCVQFELVVLYRRKEQLLNRGTKRDTSSFFGNH